MANASFYVEVESEKEKELLTKIRDELRRSQLLNSILMEKMCTYKQTLDNC